MTVRCEEMTKATAARWAEFKARRAEQYERDAKIKAVLKDFFGLCEVVALFIVAWFFLAVLYA